MNNTERKAARRKRREAERERKRDEAVAQYDSYEKVISANALIQAAKLSRKGVRWKASVQRYMMNLLRNTWNLRRKLKAGISVVQGFICFTISERGKTRHIRSVHFKERVVQRSVCDNALVPILRRSLVYDNGASLKGKGIHFALKRCAKHLRQYYRQHGSNAGWILQIDFSGYFDNIEHAPLLAQLKRAFHDTKLLWLIWQFVKSFGAKSLGIGSQVSQILAIAYPNEIDHYVREIFRIGQSGRYNDDSYYIHESREYLEALLEALKPKFDALGIKLNPRKTQIIHLKRFTFLKVRFQLTKTGKVVMKSNRESATRMRHKLKSFVPMVADGTLTMVDVRNAYQSWRGYQQHLDSHDTVRGMDKLYYQLFGVWPSVKKKKKRRNRA